MSEEQKPLALQSLNSLYIGVEPSVADNVSKNVINYMLMRVKELEKSKYEHCEECNGVLTQCGDLNDDGEPTLDCKVCQLRERVRELEEAQKQTITLEDLKDTFEQGGNYRQFPYKYFDFQTYISNRFSNAHF